MRRRAQDTRRWRPAIGLALTIIVGGMFGYVAYNQFEAQPGNQVRIGLERR